MTRTSGTLGALTQIMDLIIAFRDYRARRSRLRPDGHATRRTPAVTGTGLVFLSGSPHWPLGRLAALLGRTEQALEHFAYGGDASTPGSAPAPSSS